METLQKLFQDYISYAENLQKKTNPIKSALGLRDREIYDYGHKEFDKAVEAWVENYRYEDSTQEELLQALDILLFTAAAHEGKEAVWYLYAIQRHAVKLLPLLEENSRRTILERFGTYYPGKKRLPIQQDIFKLLQKEPVKKKKGFLPFW